jgi:anthranilate phosphoribosyltransferase
VEDRILEHFLEEFGNGADAPDAEAETLLQCLITSSNVVLIASVLSAWNRKGITADEIFALATSLREKMRPVRSQHETFADIVGTGGSPVKTFNVSTAAAFVAAGAGLPIAKHGNRAASSNSGSADVLRHLGVGLEGGPTVAERCLNEIGICFMFAPAHHSLSAALATARKSLGEPTIFNALGPLCNPASAPYQLIGSWDVKVAKEMAEAVRRLGTRRTWLVTSERALDEIAIDHHTRIFDIEGPDVSESVIAPEAFGLNVAPSHVDQIDGPAASASLIREILDNKRPDTPAEDIVVINAAAVLYIAGTESSPANAAAAARESIRTGKAANKLTQLARWTND